MALAQQLDGAQLGHACRSHFQLDPVRPPLPTSSTNWAILEGGVSEALVIILQKKNYGIKALAPTLPRVHLIITSLQPKTWPALAH